MGFMALAAEDRLECALAFLLDISVQKNLLFLFFG
jgi:hypothetical protein